VEIAILLVAAPVVILVVLAWIKSSVQRHFIRPADHDMVQMSWERSRELQHQQTNAGFWRFLAKLEFWIIVVETIVILILTNPA
jgi:hypothetical protein